MAIASHGVLRALGKNRRAEALLKDSPECLRAAVPLFSIPSWEGRWFGCFSVVTLMNGDKKRGVSYCFIVLVSIPSSMWPDMI